MRKPTMLKVLQGTLNPSREKMAAFEPIPKGELGDPPAEWKADGVELAEWNYALANCPAGMLRSTDRRSLIAWCEVCARYDELGALIRKHGFTIQTHHKMTVTSPYVTQQERAWNRMRRLASELGFTPVARSKVAVRESEQQTGSDWERLRKKTEAVEAPAKEAPAS